MDTNIIKMPKEYIYLSESSVFNNRLPVNCLFNKGITGCGGTTIAIENDIDTIIAMPYVNVIKNKENKYLNSSEHQLLCIYEGVSDVEILNYFKTHKKIKVLVTYDNLDRLVLLLKKNFIDAADNYFLLVDEYHILFNSYLFRNEAIKNVLYWGKQFKNVTYMTATPIEEEFLLDELLHLPIVGVQWEGSIKVKLTPVETNNPKLEVIRRIKDAIAGKIFGNLHFFVNSVEFIATVLKVLNIDPSLVRVICSNNAHPGRGCKTNQSKLGSTYIIDSINSEVKKINFYTSTAFEGCDIYDEDGKVIIVSDNYKNHTLLDISTLIVQICGRIRNTKYRDNIEHIFNTGENLYHNCSSLEEFKAASIKAMKDANEVITDFNNMSDNTKSKFITGFKKNGLEGFNIRYVGINENNLFVDNNLIKLDIVNYKTYKHMYKNCVTVRAEYDKTSAIELNDSKLSLYTSDKLAKTTNAKVLFKDVFNEYVALRKIYSKGQFTFGEVPVIGNAKERIDIIEQERPLVEIAYNLLGVDRVKELDYSTTKIKRELTVTNTNTSEDTKIIKLLGLSEGSVIPVSEAKSKLQEAYDILGLKDKYGKIKKATASDLIKWYEVSSCTPVIKDKRVRCITITRSKLVFK
jgi:hypothetical protein